MMKSMKRQEKLAMPWTRLEICGIIILLVLACIILTSNLSLPKMDQLASRDVLQQFKAQQEIKLANEGVTPQERVKIIEQAAQEYAASEAYQSKVQETAQEYKNFFKDPNGHLYLFQPDSYHFFRLAQNLLRNATLGNAKWEDGKLYDTVARYSFQFVRFMLFPYVLAGLAYLLGGNLVLAAFSYPVVFGCIALLLVYLIGRTLVSRTAGFAAALLLLFNPFFFANMYAGLTDTNAMNIVLSLAVITLFIQTMQTIPTRSMWLWMIASIAMLLLFSLAWSGFFYLLPILGLYLIIWLIQKKKYVWIAVVILPMAIFILANSYLIQKVIYYLNLGKQHALENGLPNPFPFVSEFSLNYSYVNQFGLTGMIVFSLILVLLCIGCWNCFKNRKRQPLLLLILCWILVLLVPAFRAFRFFYLILPPISLAAGIGIEQIATLQQFSKITKKIPAQVIAGIIVVLICLGMLPMLQSQRMNAIPVVDDSIYNTAIAIKEGSQQNATIATWWDNGYYYQALAERATFFDGSSFDSSYSYWVSRVLLEGNEDMARGILRIMDCGGANTVLATAKIFSAQQPLAWVEQAILHPEAANQQIRQRQWDEEYIKNKGIMKGNLYQLYCAPTDTYVVLSEDMLRKMYIFDYYNRWDPGKDTSDTLAASTLGLRPNLISPAYNCNAIGTKLYCELGVSLDFKAGKAYDPNGKENAFIVILENQTIAPQNVDPQKPILVFFREADGRIRYVAVMPEIINSMFVKLFLLNGANLKNFEKVSEYSGKYAKRIVTYKVVWSNITTETAQISTESTPGKANGTVKPSITILSPDGGEQFNTSFTIAWDAFDPKDNTLVYTVLLSMDGGKTFQELAKDFDGMFYTIEENTLPTGNTYVARITATNGVDTVTATSKSNFTVIQTNEKPILGHLGDRTVVVNSTLTIKISATDPKRKSLRFSTNASFGRLNSTSGIFTWTPHIAGIFPTTFIVSNSVATANESINIIVKIPTEADITPRIVRGNAYGGLPWHGEHFFIDQFESEKDVLSVYVSEQGVWSIDATEDENNNPTQVLTQNNLTFPAPNIPYESVLYPAVPFANFTITVKWLRKERSPTPGICGMFFRVNDTIFNATFPGNGTSTGYGYYSSYNFVHWTPAFDKVKSRVQGGIMNNVWQWVKIVASGNTFLFYNSSDGTEYGEPWMNGSSSLFKTGNIGLFTDHGYCQYDDLMVVEHVLNATDATSIGLAYDNDNLTGVYLYSDPKGLPQANATFHWFRDGELVMTQVNKNLSHMNSTIENGKTKVGEIWQFEITFCDTKGFCRSAKSNQVTIIPEEQ